MRDGIHYERMPDQVDVLTLRTVTTAFSPTKSHMDLVRDLIKEMHAQAVDARATVVQASELHFVRSDLGLQAYAYAVFCS